MKTGKYIFFSTISLLVFACTEEQDFGMRQGEGSPISLSASVDNNGQAGSRVNSDDVQEGQYYLTFTNTENNEVLAFEKNGKGEIPTTPSMRLKMPYVCPNMSFQSKPPTTAGIVTGK